jgi:hypothetical protein
VLPAKVPFVPPEQKVVVSVSAVPLKTWHSTERGVVPEAVMEML